MTPGTSLPSSQRVYSSLLFPSASTVLWSCSLNHQGFVSGLHARLLCSDLCGELQAVLHHAFLVPLPCLCNVLEWFSGPWQLAVLSPWVWPYFHFAMLRDQVAQHMHSTPVHPQIWEACDTKLLVIVHSSWPGFCHFIHYIMHMTIRNVYIYTYMCNLLLCSSSCSIIMGLQRVVMKNFIFLVFFSWELSCSE